MYFIDSFILGMKSKSIAYLLSASEHICWILVLEAEVHSIWVLWTRRGLQECKDNCFLKPGEAGNVFRSAQKCFFGCPRVAGLGPYPIMGPRP